MLLDFDVVREPWNKYELQDGSILKIKVVLTKVIKRVVGQDLTYDFETQNIIVTLVLDDLKGQPDTKSYSLQELQTAIVKDYIRYNTISEEWNEYVTDDGTRIRIKATLTSVARTSKYNKNGEPIYLVEVGAMAQVIPPRST